MTFWKKRSVRLRLALGYGLIAGLVFAVAGGLVYEVVEHRLRAELDRQLRIDYDLLEPVLEGLDDDGKARFRGGHGDDGYGRLASWFEIWDSDGQMLARHWPVPEERIDFVLPAPHSPDTLLFHSIEIEPGLHARLMERPTRRGGTRVVARVFRDETPMRRTLREVATVQLAALPLALFLSVIGGYFLAGRSLAPVGAMAAQAHRLTAESLGERLPVANPHDELGQLAAVFNDTLARLENSFAELKRFTADASHELRTPLTAQRAVGEAVLRDPARGHDIAELRECVADMLEEAERLAQLTDALLLLARTERDDAAMPRERFDPDALLAECAASANVLAEAKDQQLIWKGRGETDVFGDAGTLRHAVLNLLHNAVRHSPEGSRIELRCAAKGEELVIEVEDDGPGIAAQHRGQIFERFYRVDRARSRADGGAGLGLAIARRLVERQGGRLELVEKDTHGCLFRITLAGGST